jgi:hypothetical protein
MIGLHRVKLVVAICIAVLVVGGLLAYLLSSNQASVAWGRATEVRGASTVDLGSGANLYSLSCPSSGNCSAVGSYLVKQNHNRAIVVDEKNGKWGKVEALPGLTARDEGLNTGAFDVSCASPGNCSAGGTHSAGRNQLLIFVANERDGVWGRALTIPGDSALETGDFAYLSTISCASPGNCSAGGEFAGADGSRAFVLDEVRGAWGEIEPVSGTPPYGMVGSNISSISCSSPGDCSAAGTNLKGPNGLPSFVVDETNGVWGRAKEIPGLAALSPGGSDYEISLSCASVGSCGARGTYRAETGVTQSFLVDETHGVWGRAFNIPGIVALDGRHIEQLTSISCGSPGDCSAGGAYGNGSHERAFLVTEVNGHWGTPMLIPGLAALNQGHFTSVADISCSSAGNCGVIGTYSGKGGYVQSFAMTEVSGTWGVATEVGASSFPGTVGAQANDISCNSSSSCTIVGVIFSSMSNDSLFVQSTEPTS